MRNIKRLALSAALTLLLSGCGGSDAAWKGSNIEGVMPDLEFELISDAGEAVTEQAYAGKASLVFFGYMNCPDICPGTLQGLSSAIEALPVAEQDDVQVLFISVDPDRDTPEKLNAYTGFFGPQFTGLTGTQAQLSDLVKRMRATYGYGEADAKGNYAVSHSSAIYGFDGQGNAQVLMKSNQPISDFTDDIEQLLERS
ncbi:SCO family protein [Saccharospirillum impatiens]|uniref:SCO family protein n=1 Tax=Saccharospirillum impatiens TaxID=169438 RepID=UPI00040EEF12|nr:SCO family protein [Saccharospirillum impatiens]